MSLVIDETLAGVELATGLPIYEELYIAFISYLRALASFLYLPHPSLRLPRRPKWWTHRRTVPRSVGAPS